MNTINFEKRQFLVDVINPFNPEVRPIDESGVRQSKSYEYNS